MRRNSEERLVIKEVRAEKRLARRERLLHIIEASHDGSTLSTIYDIVIITLVLANVIAVVAETFEISEHLHLVFEWIEYICVAVFSIDYILHIITADLRYKLPKGKAALKFIFSFMGLVDLLALLPFYLPLISVNLRVFHVLRLLRLLWLLKLKRYTSALDSITEVIRKKWSQLATSFICLALMMLIASILMYDFEHEAQPEVYKNAFSAMWLVFASLTTVTELSAEPVTIMGRMINLVLALIDIAIVAVPTGILSAGFIEHSQENAERRREERRIAAMRDGICPHCNRPLDDIKTEHEHLQILSSIENESA